MGTQVFTPLSLAIESNIYDSHGIKKRPFSRCITLQFNKQLLNETKQNINSWSVSIELDGLCILSFTLANASLISFLVLLFQPQFTSDFSS